MVQVHLEGITKRFGKVQALRGIDLTVREGEFMTLVGPSGCGKSTLLNIIAGLEAATEGRIFFDGREVSPFSPKERDIAFVFQSYALYPHMTVFENIAFPLKMSRLPREEIRKRVEETADLLKIRELLSRKPRELSGGERQRVALGRAIVRRPKVFLFDEPLSNLDAKLRLEMRAELKRLHRGLRATFLYVTHDQTEAMTLSERLAVMKDGVILQVGTPEEVYRHPADTFVATFIGSPPMSLLETTPLSQEGVVLIGEARVPVGDALARAWTEVASSGRLLLGIRPEHLSIAKVPGEGSLRAIVSLVEPLGSESYLHLSFQGRTLRAKVAGGLEFTTDEEIFFTVSWEAVSVFHPETGRRLVWSSPLTPFEGG